MSIKLEVDKTYRSRSGEEVEIIGRVPDKFFPLRGDNGHGYMENGGFYCHKESKYDLVEEVKEEKQELKLEVGKTYRNRKGEEVKVVKFTPHKTFPFMGDKSYEYRENGRFRSDRESHLDLVEEINMEKQELKLEVGKTYRNRKGEEVKILDFDETESYPYEGDNYMDYLENGRYDVDKECDYDLVEEIKEEKQELKLEVGKTYRARNGSKVRIAAHHSGDAYPFTAYSGFTYTASGLFDVEGGSEFDLVEEIKEEKQELKLEVGKTYRNREGEEVKITKFNPNDAFPFMDSEHWHYTEKGRFSSPVTASPYDLVEEIKVKKVENNNQKQELKLEVGKTYETRAGKHLTIVSHDPNHKFYPYRGSNGHVYREDGRWEVDRPSEMDIIKEITNTSEIENINVNTKIILSLLCNMFSKMEDIKELPEEEGKRRVELYQDFLSYYNLLSNVLED